MATNPYINKFSQQNEQSIIEELIIETIKMNGIDVYYLPRKHGNLNQILGEDGSSYFDEAIPMEMYVETYDAFQGQGDFFDKFGLQVEDQLTLVVAKRVFWDNYVDWFGRKPPSGDLIYIPIEDPGYTKKKIGHIFEVKFLDDKANFYQLGTQFTFKIFCEKFQFSNETFSTGYPLIDSISKNLKYTKKVQLAIGSGNFITKESVSTNSNATATVSMWDVRDNVVSLIDIVGTFSNGDSVIGATSNAIWTIGDNKFADLTNVPQAQNEKFENHANGIVNFTETNPFGEF